MSYYYAKLKENPCVGTDASTPLLQLVCTLINRDITRIVSPMLFLHNIGVLAINSQSFNSLSLSVVC